MAPPSGAVLLSNVVPVIVIWLLGPSTYSVPAELAPTLSLKVEFVMVRAVTSSAKIVP